MVSGDNFSDPILKPRQAFSDVTNRPQKRPISSISDDSFPQSSDGFPKIDANTSDSQFGKKPRLQGFTDSAPENDKLATSVESSKFPPMERCVRLKGDAGENNSIQNDDDLLKGCSCTFCSTGSFNFPNVCGF